MEYVTIKATLDDPEYDEIEIRVRKKESLPANHKMLSWGVERAVIAWLHSHFSAWTSYIVQNGMKFLS